MNTDKGLYVFGSGAQGQLGLGDRENRNIPQLISSIDTTKTFQWKQIACGHSHNALLLGSVQKKHKNAFISSTFVSKLNVLPLENGEVYVWGCGVHGQLGLGDTNDSLVPKVVSSLLRIHINAVSCGSFHTAAINGIQ
jgi:alpha-tubulin suppressor-like RCC1 family protein